MYATNNASRTPQEVAEQLAGLGLTLTSGDVVTSSQAGAAALAELVPEGSEVLAVGGRAWPRPSAVWVSFPCERHVAVAARAGPGRRPAPPARRRTAAGVWGVAGIRP